MRIITTRRETQAIILAILAILAAILVIVFFTKSSPNSQEHKSAGGEWLEITTPMSLIHIGSNDSFAITEEGNRAAKLVYDAVAHKNLDSAKAASELYTQLIPKENYGGEYSTLQWFL